MSKKGKKYTKKVSNAMKGSKALKKFESVSDKERDLYVNKVSNVFHHYKNKISDLRSVVIRKTTKWCKEITDSVTAKWPKVKADQIVIILNAQDAFVDYVNDMCLNGVIMMRKLSVKARYERDPGNHKIVEDMKTIYQGIKNSLIVYTNNSKSAGVNTYYLAMLNRQIRHELEHYFDAMDTVSHFGEKK